MALMSVVATRLSLQHSLTQLLLLLFFLSPATIGLCKERERQRHCHRLHTCSHLYGALCTNSEGEGAQWLAAAVAWKKTTNGVRRTVCCWKLHGTVGSVVP